MQRRPHGSGWDEYVLVRSFKGLVGHDKPVPVAMPHKPSYHDVVCGRSGRRRRYSAVLMPPVPDGLALSLRRAAAWFPPGFGLQRQGEMALFRFPDLAAF